MSELEQIDDSTRPWLTLRVGRGAVIPNIAVHAGLPPPLSALVEVGEGSNISGQITLWGASPRVRIGAGVNMPGADICCGDAATIDIGDHLQSAAGSVLNARHTGSITVGNRNLWSNRVYIATDDMHAIRDLETQKRVNRRGGHVVVGNNVWLGYDCLIRGGADIGDGSVIAERARIARHIPENSCAVGTSGRVVRSNIFWTHEDAP